MSVPKASDTSELALPTMVVRTSGFVDAEIDNEVVLLNIDTGLCYGLNRVGSRIWSELAVPILVGDLCTKLQSEFEVDSTTCEREVLDLLQELRAEGLIAIQGQ
jgi:hypothetical protein